MSKRKIVFVDRDGVLNYCTLGKYITHVSELKLLPGVKEALRRLTQANYEIHIISNQQGVAKGITRKKDLEELTQALLARVHKVGGKISSVNYCTHLESDKCKCRKPATGLFLQALQGTQVEPSKTWMIGDSWRDIEAGKAFGAQTIFLKNRAYSLYSKGTYTDGKHVFRPDHATNNLPQAVELILKANGKKKASTSKK